MQLELTLSIPSKQCPKCGDLKTVLDFYKDKSRKDGLYHWCKPCCLQHQAKRWRDMNQSDKARHYNSHQRYRMRLRGEETSFERKRRTPAEQRIARRELNRTIKRIVGCQVCGEREPSALDFHHIDPKSKSFIIARQGRFSSFKALIEEIMKCCCVCANCHRKHHSGVSPLNLQSINWDQIDQAIATLNDANTV